MRQIQDKYGKCWQVTELINFVDPNVKTLQLKCENGEIFTIPYAALNTMNDEQIVQLIEATEPGQRDTMSDEHFAQFIKLNESQQSKP